MNVISQMSRNIFPTQQYHNILEKILNKIKDFFVVILPLTIYTSEQGNHSRYIDHCHHDYSIYKMVICFYDLLSFNFVPFILPSVLHCENIVNNRTFNF